MASYTFALTRRTANQCAQLYPVGDASGENRLDDDACALAADDAEAEPSAVINQVNHFQLAPLRAQLQHTHTHSKLPMSYMYMY